MCMNLQNRTHRVSKTLYSVLESRISDETNAPIFAVLLNTFQVAGFTDPDYASLYICSVDCDMDEGDDSNPDRITSSAFATVNIFMQVKSVEEFEPRAYCSYSFFGQELVDANYNPQILQPKPPPLPPPKKKKEEDDDDDGDDDDDDDGV